MGLEVATHDEFAAVASVLAAEVADLIRTLGFTMRHYQPEGVEFLISDWSL